MNSDVDFSDFPSWNCVQGYPNELKGRRIASLEHSQVNLLFFAFNTRTQTTDKRACCVTMVPHPKRLRSQWACQSMGCMEKSTALFIHFVISNKSFIRHFIQIRYVGENLVYCSSEASQILNCLFWCDLKVLIPHKMWLQMFFSHFLLSEFEFPYHAP